VVIHIKSKKQEGFMDSKYFGGNLQRLRKGRGLSQKDLAGVLDVTDITISNFENSKRFPDIHTLIRVAEFFGKSVDSLLSVESAFEGDLMQNCVKDFEETYSIIYIEDSKTTEFGVFKSRDFAEKVVDSISGYYSLLKGRLEVEKKIGKDAGSNFSLSLIREFDNKHNYFITLPIPIKTRAGVKSIHAVFEICADCIDGFKEVATYISDDGAILSFTDTDYYNIFDSLVKIPDYASNLKQYSYNQKQLASKELVDIFPDVLKCAFDINLSKVEYETVIKYRELLFMASDSGMREYYYILGEGFFNWLEMVEWSESNAENANI
jgi:transcriptional regulator with XRE-family HTH domain